MRVEVERVDEGTLRLSVSDDGVGLAPDFDLNRTGSLGLQPGDNADPANRRRDGTKTGPGNAL